MATPAIQAILFLTLTLLVTLVGADHAHGTMPADHLALVAHFLDRRPDLHRTDSLLVPIGDTTTREVVRRELDLDLVAGSDTDVVHPHLPGDVSEHLVPVLQLDTEHGVRQRLDH